MLNSRRHFDLQVGYALVVLAAILRNLNVQRTLYKHINANTVNRYLNILGDDVFILLVQDGLHRFDVRPRIKHVVLELNFDWCQLVSQFVLCKIESET